MKTITIPLSNPVAAGGTITGSYPSGESRTSYMSSGATLVIGNNVYSTGFTLTLGASSFTVTNPGQALGSGAVVRLTLYTPADFMGATIAALANAAGHVEYPGSPVGNVTPARVGQRCQDTTTGLFYVAQTLTSAGWTLTKAPATPSAHLFGCIGDSITQQCMNSSATTNTIVVTPVNGGTGYAVNDAILMPYGVLLQVSAVSSGAVTTAIVSNAGTAPFTAQSTAQSQVATTGGGSGFTATWAAKGSGGLRTLNAQGYAVWAQLLSNGKMLVSPECVWGLPGKGTTEVLAFLPNYLAALQSSGVQMAIVHIGTNDVFFFGRSYATTVANLQSIYRYLSANGITVIAVPILPRSYDGSGDTGATATQLRQAARINQWIIRYARDNPGVILADPTLNWIDTSSATGYPIPATVKSAASYTANSNSWTYDGLHPTPAGAQFIGKAISDAVSPLFAVDDTRMVTSADTYDATNNPTGNLLANGMMVTASGGTAGTGASGTVVGSFTLDRYIGSAGTVTASVTTVTNDNGTTYNQQTLAFDTTAGGSAEGWRLYQQIFSNYAQGDQIYAECEITVSGAQSGCIGALYLQCDDTFTQCKMPGDTTNQVHAGVNFSGVLRTLPFTVGAASPGITWRLNVGLLGASKTLTVKVGKITMRKV